MERWEREGGAARGAMGSTWSAAKGRVVTACARGLSWLHVATGRYAGRPALGVTSGREYGGSMPEVELLGGPALEHAGAAGYAF